MLLLHILVTILSSYFYTFWLRFYQVTFTHSGYDFIKLLLHILVTILSSYFFTFWLRFYQIVCIISAKFLHFFQSFLLFYSDKIEILPVEI